MEIFDPDNPGFSTPHIDASNGGDGSKPLHPVARGIRWLADTIRYRLMFVWGILLLAIGLAFLSSAWQEFSGEKQAILDRLTAQGTVRVLDSSVWILPQSNPETKLDPSRALWHHDFFFEHTLELSYRPDHPVKSYRSNHSGDLADISRFWPVLANDPVFRTPHLTIKFDSNLYGLLTGTPAQAGGAFKMLDAPEDAPKEERYTMGSQFDQFWVWIDWPMHALALQWLSDSGRLEIPVRYDPHEPDRFLFESQYIEALKPHSRTQALIGAVILAGFGLFTLVFAVTLLTHEMSKYIFAALYIGIVIMVPFGSHYLKAAVNYFGLPGIGKYFVEEWIHSMDARAQAGFLEELPDSVIRPGTVLPIDATHSRYQNVFSYFQLNRGTAQFTSFDDAMKAISSQIAEQIVSMPTQDQFRFFKILDNHMSHRRAGWAAPFLEGVRAIALDGNRSKNLRSWAISAFCDMCMDLNDAQLAEFIYQQYVTGEDDVKPYWRRNFWNYYQAPGFVADLNSLDPVRIKRALDIWSGAHHFMKDVQFLAPRLKELTNYPDPEIREMATKKWNSRTDWPNS